MAGASRFRMKHRISSRKSDFIREQQNRSIVRPREYRISFTFRRSKDISAKIGDMVKSVEVEHVKETYEKIAQSFSKTRYKIWPIVKRFLAMVNPNSLLLEVGCGNGKNLLLDSNYLMIGTDICEGFCRIVRENKGVDSIVSDCVRLPIKSNIFDAVLCVAVIHHLSSEERRRSAVGEMIRVLKPGGLLFISVWAFEQEKDGIKSIYASKSDAECSFGAIDGIPVHPSKTKFLTQDVLVPWKSDGHDLCRFYHVFKKSELTNLICGFGNVEIVEGEMYEQGNWCIVLKKNEV